MDFIWSDEFLLVVVPTVVYWLYSGIYEVFGSFESYRLHSRIDEEAKNLVPKSTVVKGVLFQQAIQATILLGVAKVIGSDAAETPTDAETSPAATARTFLVAMLIFDTWQYFAHRAMHRSKFLYRHFHSWHHRVVAPYAFAAQYSHPVDAIITEAVAGALAYFGSGMSRKTTIAFYTFATIKGVDDHCGLLLPWNPFHLLFGNNAAYHSIHHQLAGGKCNFAQPFFLLWDKLLGTHVPYVIQKRAAGGFEARPAKED